LLYSPFAGRPAFDREKVFAGEYLGHNQDAKAKAVTECLHILYRGRLIVKAASLAEAAMR